MCSWSCHGSTNWYPFRKGAVLSPRFAHFHPTSPFPHLRRSINEKKRRGSCLSGHSLLSAHYFLVWADSLTWLGSQTQECFCSFKEGLYRNAGVTVGQVQGFFSPYWTLNCSLANQTALSWTFKSQITWIVAGEEANLQICHLFRGQGKGMSETPLSKPKPSFNILQN